MNSTAVLRVRYNGEILEIPALVGKNAYQYAVEGGFTGTQEEFSQLLASIADKVNAEAFEAHNTDEEAHQDIRDILASVSNVIEIQKL
jgi:flagellar hook-basal body complex protein FliE